MRKPFEINDRVAVYEPFRRSVMYLAQRCIDNNWWVKNEPDGPFIKQVHEKQIRRLKPKPKKREPRRVWCRLNHDGSVYDHTTKCPITDIAPLGVWVEFQEVIK